MVVYSINTIKKKEKESKTDMWT